MLGSYGSGRFFVLALLAALVGQQWTVAHAQQLRGGHSGNTSSAPRRLTWKSPVEEHGWLRTEGNKILDQHDQPVRLRGMSLFWSQWMPQYWNEATVHWLRSDWHVSVVRAAMGVSAEHGGYLANKEAQRDQVEVVVQAAIHAGIYVIVDWHDHQAEQHPEEAEDFFRYMAQRYGRFPNVLWETYNEPYPGVPWSTIKAYHERILGVIRQHAWTVVILGSAEWSQWVDEASADPVAGYNLAYAIHFYAAQPDHNAPLKARVETALNNGVPVFASEWGVCHYTGEGALSTEEGDAWLSFMAEHHISDTAWAVSNKPGESCSTLHPSPWSGGGAWTPEMLTENGNYLRNSLRGDGGGSCSAEFEDCRQTLCCADASKTCFQKDPFWAECRDTCTVGIDYEKDPDPRWQTPWSCVDLGRRDVEAAPLCAASGAEDCRETRCCLQPGTKCYSKNEWWAACRAACTPGIDPVEGVEWSCEELLPDPAPTPAPIAPSPGTENCAGDVENCRWSACCKRPGTRCYAKDGHWAECKETCERGKVDFSDPYEYWTPWTCDEIH